VVDLSGSMADDGALAASRRASKIAENLPEGDELAIVSFNDAVVLETGVHRQPCAARRAAIDEMVAPRDGKGAMWDAIRKATQLFATRPDLQPNMCWSPTAATTCPRPTSTAPGRRRGLVGAAFFAVELDHMEGTDTDAIDSIMERAAARRSPASAPGKVAKAFDAMTTILQSQYVASYASKVEQGQVDVDRQRRQPRAPSGTTSPAQVQGAGATAEVVE
jgi:hypothetical protein